MPLAQCTDPTQAAHWLRAQGALALQTDSRRVQAGDAFLAWPGAHHDARAHVGAALSAGARACLVEHQEVAALAFADARIGTYSALQSDAGKIASAYFDDPSSQLAVLAVTGTNGKTSSAWWIAQALSQLALVAPKACGFIGTLGIGQVPELSSSGLTTPDAVTLQTAFAKFAAQGLQACAIEASSIGIDAHRLAGTHIHTAVFTNLTQDHLDYHGSMAAYGRAKAALFNWPGLRAAVINIDDPYGDALACSAPWAPSHPQLDLWCVSMADGAAKRARLAAQQIVRRAQGLQFCVQEGAQRATLASALIGDYNVANLLGVLASLRSLGVPLDAAVQACSHLTPVPGRMQCLRASGQALVAVDYAHTPDALAKALMALQPLAKARGGQLWCVFGCGGERDRSKRALMGAIAAQQAERIVLTSDNPRSEAPDAIISQILLGLQGVSGVLVEPDRGLAIALALDSASANDVVLLAGKGHEDYQEINGQKRAFSDLEQVKKVFAMKPGKVPRQVAA